MTSGGWQLVQRESRTPEGWGSGPGRLYGGLLEKEGQAHSRRIFKKKRDGRFEITVAVKSFGLEGISE